MNARRSGVKVSVFLVIFALCRAGVISVEVPAPDFEILDGRLIVEDVAYQNEIGAPNVPCRIITLAVPPGAIVQRVLW